MGLKEHDISMSTVPSTASSEAVILMVRHIDRLLLLLLLSAQLAEETKVSDTHVDDGGTKTGYGPLAGLRHLELRRICSSSNLKVYTTLMKM